MFKLLTIILMIVLTFFNGCGIAANMRAREDVENSKAAYKQCLEQHPNDPSQCEGLRRAYEADLKYWKERVKIFKPGYTVSVDND